jgi:hypothetical protein
MLYVRIVLRASCDAPEIHVSGLGGENAVNIFGSVVQALRSSSADPSISVALLVRNHAGRSARQSCLKPLAIHAVMSEHEEEDVAKVIRAVRTAYDDLQALRASRHSNIPSSLSNVDKTLDKLWCKLNILNGLPEALSVFCEYTVNVTSNSVVILLSGAIVNDMEATAKYLRNMMRVGLASLSGDVHEQNCRKIQQTVDRYEAIVSTLLSKHKECVHGE